jgi:hypothetical protein
MPFDPNEALDQYKQQTTKRTFDPSQALERYNTPDINTVKEVFGADFDENSVAPTSLRHNLARGDNLAEKKIRLKNEHPKGDLKVFGPSLAMGIEKPVLLYRETPEQQWKFVDPPGFIRRPAKDTAPEPKQFHFLTREGDVRNVTVRPSPEGWEVDWPDISEEIAPSFESIAAETAAAIATRGASIIKLVGTQMLAAFTGETLEQVYQSATGLQAQTPSEILMEPAFEAAASGAGAAVASPFVAARNVAKGAGAMRVGPEGIEALQAAGRLDPALQRGLTPGMVVDNPAIRISERQAASILPGLGRRYRALAIRLDEVISQSAKGKEAKKAAERFVQGMKSFGDMFISKLKVTKTGWRKGGLSLQQSIDAYRNSSRAMVKQAYDAARKIEEPIFVWDDVTNTITDLRAGSKGLLDNRIETAIKNLEDISGPKQLSGGKTLSVTDQIRNVRTELFDIQYSGQEIGGQFKGQANDLIKSINKMMAEPANTTEGFITAWKAANDAAALRTGTLKKAAVLKAIRTETPAKLARDFAQPNEVDSLLLLRDTVDRVRWNNFQESFYSDLLTNPSKLSAKLKSFDQETLDVLMSRADQKIWTEVGQELDRIYSIGADEILENQVKNKQFINAFVNKATPQMAKTLKRAMKSKTAPPGMQQSIRAAIVDWAWDGVITKTKSGMKVQKNILKRNIEILGNADLLDLLSKKQRQVLADADTLPRAFEQVADAGTALLGASAVAGVRELRPSAIKTFVENFLVSHIYLSDAGRQILLGSGAPHSTGKTLRLMLGALAQTAPPEDIDALLKEQEMAFDPLQE